MVGRVKPVFHDLVVVVRSRVELHNVSPELKGVTRCVFVQVSFFSSQQAISSTETACGQTMVAIWVKIVFILLFLI